MYVNGVFVLSVCLCGCVGCGVYVSSVCLEVEVGHEEGASVSTCIMLHLLTSVQLLEEGRST